MMQTISACEAKTRLPELLREVERGESFTVTRHGVPVARILGIAETERDDVATVIARIKRARASRPSVSLEEIIATRDEGRR